MATTESSALAHPSTQYVPATEDREHVGSIVPRALGLSARLQRGIDLAEERFEDVEKIAPWTWRVPSCSGPLFYVVDLKHGLCTCPDHPPEGERCKHVSAAAFVKAKTATCSGCRKRFRHRDLYEVHEDHGSLIWFVGDLLCGGCALDTDIL